MHWFQNFRECIQTQFPGTIKHGSVANIHFKNDVATGSSGDPACAEVEYPQHYNGWTITPNRSPCEVKLV